VTRCPADGLEALAAALFTAAGLAPDRARIVARGFLEADLLGFTTHGLARVPDNVRWLESGATRAEGEVRVLAETAAAANWDADFLPGAYALHLAVEAAAARAPTTGVYTLTLRRCQHVACLASHLVRLVERHLIGMLMVSTPDERYVSAHQGATPLYSNNPIAFCAPATGGPLLFDVSTAITAGGQVARAAQEHRRLPEPILRDAAGRITDDPSALAAGGSVMPVGGTGHGHKGFALTLMTEVLTQALGGYGRARREGDGEANSVFLQVIDPAAFTGRGDYLREIDLLLARTRDSTPVDPAEPVRVPGQRAWQRRQERLVGGVDLYPGILDALLVEAERLAVAIPEWARRA